MATQDETQQEQDAFAESFAEDVKTTEMSDDEAFGLVDDEPNEDEAEVLEEPAMEATEEPGEPEAAAASAAPGEAPAVVIEPSAQDTGDVELDPKELQRQKSWEGRLKAKEAELKAREDALKSSNEPTEPGETMAEESAEAPTVEALEDAVDKVESGEITVEQAMQTMANDFGPDFTKMLSVLIDARASEIAGKTADERVGAVRGDLDGVIGELVSEKEKMHYELISDAHPDFMDVAGSAEFKGYVEALPGSEQEAAMQVINSGSAKQINALLTAYKATQQGDEAKPQEAPDSAAMDAAEGVRSGGIKIPERPAKTDDYEAAWSEFN